MPDEPCSDSARERRMGEETQRPETVVDGDQDDALPCQQPQTRSMSWISTRSSRQAQYEGRQNQSPDAEYACADERG